MLFSLRYWSDVGIGNTCSFVEVNFYRKSNNKLAAVRLILLALDLVTITMKHCKWSQKIYHGHNYMSDMKYRVSQKHKTNI